MIGLNHRHSNWRAHASHLEANTALSTREAEVLALWKTNHSVEDISSILTLYEDTVTETLDAVDDQRDRAQLLCTVMDPDGINRDDGHARHRLNQSPWNLITSATLEQSAGEGSVELELFHGESGTMSDSYLFVEREIVSEDEFTTTTTTRRSIHDPLGLSKQVFRDVDTLQEYWIRWALIAKAGVDPGEGECRYDEFNDRDDVSDEEIEKCRERGRRQVDLHSTD